MDSHLPPLLQATSGALGSAVGNAIVFPLDAATTRMQHASTRRRVTKRKLSLLQTLLRLSRRRGLQGMYAGLPADTLSTLLSSFLYFLSYTTLHRLLVRLHSSASQAANYLPRSSPAGIGGAYTKASDIGPSQSRRLSGWEDVVVGVLAGVFSKGITLPISAVCVRQQLESEDDDDDNNPVTTTKGKDLSLIETLLLIHKEEGLAGLFSALPPSIPLALLPSLTLYIHSLLLRLLVPASRRDHPPPALTFGLGALSNAIATLPLYPLVLIKSLDQGGQGKGKEKEGQGGMVRTMNRIVKLEGVGGLYKGVEGQLVKGFVQQGVMMVLKQRIEEIVVKMYQRRR